MRKQRTSKQNSPKKKTSKHRKNIIEILNLDENRATLIAKEGFAIRESSSSDGEFLKNLLENKSLYDTEKLLVAYKVGFVDGSEIAAHSLIERMNKEFEEIEKKVDKERECENKSMYN